MIALGNLSATVSPAVIQLGDQDEFDACVAIDPVEATGLGEGDQIVDLERYLLDLQAGALLGFQILGDGGTIRLQRRRFDAVADFAEARVILLVRPEDAENVRLHGHLLTVVVGNDTVAGRGVAASRSPEGREA